MRFGRRAAVALLGALAAGIALARPAAAHGVGGRTDLPLPLWLFTWGAALAVALSFVVVTWFWPEPRLARVAAGRALPDPMQRAARVLAVPVRVLGVGLLALVLVAALWGDTAANRNIAPLAFYIYFWVVMQVVVAVLGDVWRVLNPYLTLTWVSARLFRRPRATTNRRDPGQWTAAAMLFAFVWIELAYFESSSVRAIGTWLALYSVAALVGAAIWGRSWLRYGEGFAGLFTMLSHLGLFHYGETDSRLRVRPPVTGLALMEARRGTLALVVVALGSTAFDGLTRTRFWLDVAGSRAEWELTAVNTLGLVWMIVLVALAYAVAIRVMARIVDEDPARLSDAFVPSLVPIVLAYAVAHYFSLVVFEGQQAWPLLSDPFGRGWDLFGTGGYTIRYQAVSTTTIAYVQAGAIVVGHILGVIVAHDRAVELFDRRLAVRSQFPMVVVMVAYTIGGLALLLGT